MQNEKDFIPTEIKIEFIDRLSATGLSCIEVTSFVSPKWIPQMADNAKVYQGISREPTISYPALVPNIHGFHAAQQNGCDTIAIFTAASETFCQKNMNCSIEQSLERFGDVITQAQKNHIKVRGYISCVLGCPYEGQIDPQIVAHLAKQLFQLGCYEISLGDTIGIGTPHQAQGLIDCVAQQIPREHIAAHFHDTYGQALANLYAVLEKGICVIDSSVAGLGGCPYAQGATGNVASEDVLYMLNGLGIQTGVDLTALIAAGEFIMQHLNHPNRAKVANALKQ